MDQSWNFLKEMAYQVFSVNFSEYEGGSFIEKI